MDPKSTPDWKQVCTGIEVHVSPCWRKEVCIAPLLDLFAENMPTRLPLRQHVEPATPYRYIRYDVLFPESRTQAAKLPCNAKFNVSSLRH